ncbi:MAG: mandelate racemase, partial [Nitrososphaerales archaeon]
MLSSAIPIEKIDVSAYTIPTDGPEADGTYTWRETPIVIVEARAGGVTGLGYTYANAATARLIRESLAKTVEGCDAMSVEAAWWDMLGVVRNIGQPGVTAMAISGVDNALWDLKGRLLGLPLVTLLGAVRDGVPVYGSGGFTSYSDQRLQDQLGGWAASGITRVKMKIGTQPERDLCRAQVARRAIGPATQL